MTRLIDRQCIECGSDITVSLADDGTILGGAAYFGEVEFPIEETGEYERTGEIIIFDTGDGSGIETIDEADADDYDYEASYPIVHWTGDYETIEYWECDDCNTERTSKHFDTPEYPADDERDD